MCKSVDTAEAEIGIIWPQESNMVVGTVHWTWKEKENCTIPLLLVLYIILPFCVYFISLLCFFTMMSPRH